MPRGEEMTDEHMVNQCQKALDAMMTGPWFHVEDESGFNAGIASSDWMDKQGEAISLGKTPDSLPDVYCWQDGGPENPTPDEVGIVMLRNNAARLIELARRAIDIRSAAEDD